MTLRAAIALLVCLSAPSAAAATFEENLLTELGRRPAFAAGPADERAARVLEAFYRARDLAPIWVAKDAAGPRAREATSVLAAAGEDGLDPSAYGVETILSLLPTSSPADLARLEAAISRGILRFLADLGRGRVTPQVDDPKLFLHRRQVDQAELMTAAAGARDLSALVTRQRPQSRSYEALRRALAAYRKVASEGGWKPTPSGPALRIGSIDRRVPALRLRLALSGDLRLHKRRPSALYDQALAAAVRRAQLRHGLKTDGVVGPATLAALNLPVERRIDQIVLNLERLRWMPDDLGRRFVYINLADFTLQLVEDGRQILDLRVVVGQPFQSTPIFSHRMTSVVFNADWVVPPRIAGEDLLPLIRKDPDYLARNGFTLFSDWSSGARVLEPGSVDWSKVDGASFPFRLRQAPGPKNPLGRMKFLFPNEFSVYLHDTPSKGLFDNEDRSGSHGCIRVESPERLAGALLAGASDWSRDRIARVVAAGATKAVSLPEPVPIHITYMTAWSEGESLHFRKDVYGRDASLAAAIRSAPRN